jgi:hypothetical protein
MIELFHRGVKGVKIGMDKTGHTVTLTYVKADCKKEQGSGRTAGVSGRISGARRPDR